MSDLLELPEHPTKANIIKFEKIASTRGQKIQLEVKHHFAEGVYARELIIPAGVWLTGKIHKYEQLNILASGKMNVCIDDKWHLIEGPYTVVSPAGIKRIAETISDCVWVTIIRTDLTDPDAIESYYVTNDENEFREFLKANEQLKLAL